MAADPVINYAGRRDGCAGVYWTIRAPAEQINDLARTKAVELGCYEYETRAKWHTKLMWKSAFPGVRKNFRVNFREEEVDAEIGFIASDHR